MLFYNMWYLFFTLVLGDWGHIFSRGGQTEDPSAIDASFCLNIVLEGAVYSSGQTGDILRLKHQLGEKRKEERKDQYTSSEIP